MAHHHDARQVPEGRRRLGFGTATALLLSLAALSLSACSTSVYAGAPRSEGRRAEGRCSVPPGHLPPPGQCRIWYPGRPPGQQPPPGDCRELRHQVPSGACLIVG